MTNPVVKTFLAWSVGNYLGRVIYQTLLSSNPVELGSALLDPGNIFTATLVGAIVAGISYSMDKRAQQKEIDNIAKKLPQKPELASMSAIQLLQEIKDTIGSIESLAGKIDAAKKSSYMGVIDQLSEKLSGINLIDNAQERQQEMEHFKKHLLVGANILKNSQDTIKVSQKMQSKTAQQAQENSLVIVDLLIVFLKQSFLDPERDNQVKNRPAASAVFKEPHRLSSLQSYK